MKYQLPEDEEVSDLFNDLLILRHIVPGLPKDTIRSLLHELKPHTACDASALDSPVDFAKINIILSQVKRPSQLLTDFLACSGVVPVGTAWYLPLDLFQSFLMFFIYPSICSLSLRINYR